MKILGFATFFAFCIVLGFTSCVNPTTPQNINASPMPVGSLQINELGFPYYGDGSAVVEIYNPGTVTYNLSQYQLRSPYRTNPENGVNSAYYESTIFKLPSVDIAPKTYMVVRGRSISYFESGSQTLYIANGNGANSPYPWFMSDSGYVELQDLLGNTIDFVRWGQITVGPSSSSYEFTGQAPNLISTEDASASLGWALARNAAGDNTRSATDWSINKFLTSGGPNDVLATALSSDGDGIPDSAKYGTWAGLRLGDWGAKRGQKDIFVHIDYMDNSSTGDEGMVPRKEALDKIRDVFLKHGYHIHFDVGDLYSSTVGEANWNLDGRSHKVPYAKDGVNFGKDPSGVMANVYKYKASYMPMAKKGIFFYVLFADTLGSQMAQYAGLSEINGDIAIISLGHQGLTSKGNANLTVEQSTNFLINCQAADLFHEFGHSLGLLHGGNEDINFKPNYFSTMNYMYSYGLPLLGYEDTRYYSRLINNAIAVAAAKGQTLKPSDVTSAAWVERSLGRNWGGNSPWDSPSKLTIDYSSGLRPNLDENNCIESKGIGSGSVGIDFNNSGSIGSSSASIDILLKLGQNTSIDTPTKRGVLKDYDDWAHISTLFRHSYAGFNNSTSRNIADEQQLEPIRSLHMDRPGAIGDPDPMPFRYINY